MKKLSNAQLKTMDRLQEQYNVKAYDNSFFKKQLNEVDRSEFNEEMKEHMVEFYKYHIEMINNGFILVHSVNSRTLEILKENGLIDYVKSTRSDKHPIVWVKVLD